MKKCYYSRSSSAVIITRRNGKLDNHGDEVKHRCPHSVVKLLQKRSCDSWRSFKAPKIVKVVCLTVFFLLTSTSHGILSVRASRIQRK